MNRLVVTLKPGRVGFHAIEHFNQCGFNNFRINFARNTVHENMVFFNQLRTANNRIFIDLPGEKWRINYQGGVRILMPNDLIRIQYGDYIDSNVSIATVSEKLLFENISVGDYVLIGDSNTGLIVTECDEYAFVLQCIEQGKIYNKAGISIRGKYVPKQHLCNADRSLLSQLSFRSIDYLCVSFADCSNIIYELKEDFPECKDTKIIAKIESPIGVQNIDSILAACDGILLARSDLSKFYNYSELSDTAEQFRQSVIPPKCLIFASNYFMDSVRSKRVYEYEKNRYIHDFNLKPDYIYVNETYYSEDSFYVLHCYTECIKNLT